MPSENLNNFFKKYGFNSSTDTVYSTKNKHGFTPIAWAAYLDEWDLVIELARILQETENSNDCSDSGKALLYAVAALEKKAMDELFKIKHLAMHHTIELGESKGWGLAHYAALQDNLDLLKQLLALGCDVNQHYSDKDVMRAPPIFIALNSNKDEVIEFLLKQKLDLTQKNKHGENIIEVIAEIKDFKFKPLLLDLIDKTPNPGDVLELGRALLTATDKDNGAFACDLLKRAVTKCEWRFKSGDKKGHGVVHRAIANKNLTVLSALMNSPHSNINCSYLEFLTPVEFAIEQENEPALKLMLESGKVDLTFNNKNRPLSYAVTNKKWAMASILREYIIKTGYKKDEAHVGEAVMDAIIDKNFEFAEELLEVSDLKLGWYYPEDKKSLNYLGPIDFCIKYNKTKLVEKLIKAGAGLSKPELSDGIIAAEPLETAFKYKNSRALFLLISAGAPLARLPTIEFGKVDEIISRMISNAVDLFNKQYKSNCQLTSQVKDKFTTVLFSDLLSNEAFINAFFFKSEDYLKAFISKFSEQFTKIIANHYFTKRTIHSYWSSMFNEDFDIGFTETIDGKQDFITLCVEAYSPETTVEVTIQGNIDNSLSTTLRKRN